MRLLFAIVLSIGASACSPAIAPGEGLVVGGVIPCAGLAPPPGVQYAAATVTVLEGTERWQTTGPGTARPVLPARVAGSETVSANQMYEFNLRPGAYVLAARFTGSAAGEPFIDVDVTAGTTQSVNIPNSCL